MTVDPRMERRAQVARIDEAQAAVASEAAKLINCPADDPTLASWVAVVTVAAIKAGWIPAYAARPAPVVAPSAKGSE